MGRYTYRESAAIRKKNAASCVWLLTPGSVDALQDTYTHLTE